MTTTAGKQRTKRTLAEKVTFGISLALLVVLVGMLVTFQVVSSDDPPAFEVKPNFGGIRNDAGRYYLPVEVTNVGHQTPDAVHIDFELAASQGEPIPNTLDFTFIAGGETLDGELVFDEEPTADALSVTALSFTLP